MSDFNKRYNDITIQITNSPVMQSFLELADIKVPIILYGCGEQAALILNFCNYYNIKITAFADSVQCGCFDNTQLSILSPAELSSTYPDAVIIISSWKFDNEIYDSLTRLGFPDENIRRFPFSHPYVLTKDTLEVQYLEGYRWAYDFFDDDLSKQIILNRIGAYLFDEKMVKTSVKPMYFEFPLAEKEVFVQAGCYDGDTVRDFIEYYTMKPQYKIYTFEADPQAFEVSKNNLSDYNNVQLVPNGLWNTETVLTFHTDAMSGGASFVNGSKNEIRIPVTSLDTFLQINQNRHLYNLILKGLSLRHLKVLRKLSEIINRNWPFVCITNMRISTKYRNYSTNIIQIINSGCSIVKSVSTAQFFMRCEHRRFKLLCLI